MWWIAVIVYVIGWLPSAVRITRHRTEPKPPTPPVQPLPPAYRCHQEDKDGKDGHYLWPEEHLCRKYCKPGCWRMDPPLPPVPMPPLPPRVVTWQDAAIGCGCALWWPPLLPVWVVRRLALREPKVPLTDAQLLVIERQMETLAGIENLP